MPRHTNKVKVGQKAHNFGFFVTIPKEVATEAEIEKGQTLEATWNENLGALLYYPIKNRRTK